MSGSGILTYTIKPGEYAWFDELKEGVSQGRHIKDKILNIQKNIEPNSVSNNNNSSINGVGGNVVHAKCFLPLTEFLLSQKYKDKDANVFVQTTLERILENMVTFLKNIVEQNENNKRVSNKNKNNKEELKNAKKKDSNSKTSTHNMDLEKDSQKFVDECFLIVREITASTSTYNLKYGYIAPWGEKASSDVETYSSSEDEDTEEHEDEIDPAWRSKIGFADWVDFLDDKKNTWSRAQIIEENQPEFKFKIQKEGDHEYQAEWVEIWSERIAPDNTKTKAAQKKIKKFQKKLKQGDAVDARGDINRAWHSGKAIEFRTNDENIEEVQICFDGHVSNAWVPRYGLQIAPPFTHTEKNVGSNFSGVWQNGMSSFSSNNPVEKPELYTIGNDDSDESDEEEGIDDSKNENNVNYDELRSRMKDYAASHFKHRKGYDESLSARICLILEFFYKLDGWDVLYDNVGPSFKRIQIFVDILSNLSYTASRCFCKEYYKKAVALIKRNMMLLNTNELRSLSISKVDAMVRKLELNVLPRIRRDIVEAAEYSERFFLAFSTFLFKCDLLPRRLDGLKRFLELADSTKRYMNTAKFLKPEHVLITFREEKLLSELIKVGQHQEILKRSADVLKWIAGQNDLQLVDVQMLWEAGNTTGRDLDTTSSIYKIICDLSNSYEEDHYKYFAKMFAEETFQSINVQKLNVMAELGNDGARKSQDASSNIGQTLLKFCLSDSPIIDGAIDAFVKFIKSYFLKSQRSEYCLQCFQNLIDQNYIAQTLLLFPRIIETFDDTSYANNPTKTSIINSMDNNGNDIIDIVLDLPDIYIDEVLKFLGTFMPLAKRKLSSSIIKRLWTEKTHEQMCKWVAHSGIQNMLQDESQIYIIENIICQRDRVAWTSRNEFDCFCQLFFLLNERFRNITRAGRDQSKNIVLTSVLYTIDSIWDCAIYAKDDMVGNDAIKILISLCDEDCWDSHLQTTCFLTQDDLCIESSDISVDCGKTSSISVSPTANDPSYYNSIDKTLLYRDLWEIHVDKCCMYLSQINVRNDPNRVGRCFRLLEGVLEKSERFGLKHLRAHVHRSRGRPVKPCIICDDIKFYLQGYANDTLWALREAIASNLKVDANDFELFMNRNNKKVTFTEGDNSKTLFQNNFRKRENIHVKLNPQVKSKGKMQESLEATPLGTAPYSNDTSGRGKEVEIIQKDQKSVERKNMPIKVKKVINEPRCKRAILLLPDKTPTRRFEQVIYSIFAQHSIDEKLMSRDEIVDYFVYCGASGKSLEDSRIDNIISNNDFATNDNEDLCMTRKGFLQFYTEAAVSRKDNVWADLKKHGYDNNLVRMVKTVEITGESGIILQKIVFAGETLEPRKNESNVAGSDEPDPTVIPTVNNFPNSIVEPNFQLIERAAKHMPRYWLVHKKAYREILFNFLRDDIDGITHTVWEFIMRLPTNPDNLDSIRSFQEKDMPDWQGLFNPKSVYSLVYSLQIVEFLVDPVDVDCNNNFAMNDSANGTFSNNPTPVNSPVRLKKRKGGETRDSDELSRSLSIGEVDIKTAIDDAVSWKLQFLQRGGFLYLLNIFLERNVLFSQDSSLNDIESSLDTLANGLLLKLVRAFLLAAMSSRGTNYHDIAELVRRRSSENKSFTLDAASNAVLLKEDSANFNAGLQTLLQQNLSIPSSPSSIGNFVNSNVISPKMSALLMDLGTTPPPGKDFLSLVRQMSDGGSHTVAENILKNIDLAKLQARLFDFLMVSERTLNGHETNEKQRFNQKNKYNIRRIVERAVGLWVALTVYEPAIFEKFVESKELRDRFFTCLLSPCKNVRREMAHATRILTCIDKNNENYNQNNDSPTIIVLRVLLSKIYDDNNSRGASKTDVSISVNSKNNGLVYDYCYDLSASILLDVLGMKSQVYYDIFNLNLLSGIMVKKVAASFTSSDFKNTDHLTHAIGAMKILTTILGNIDVIKDTRTRNDIKDACRSSNLAEILMANIVFSDINLSNDKKERCDIRTIALELVESIIFLDKFGLVNSGLNDDQKNYTVTTYDDDLDDDLIFGSASDFDFNSDESNNGKASIHEKHSLSRFANWRNSSQYGLYDILCLLDDVHVSIQTVPLKTLNMAINSMNRHDNSKIEPSSVGIQNLGSTCYMNSVFQQLYAIQDIRDAVLTAQLVGAESNNGSINSENSSRNSDLILDSVQEMFWRMELTNLPYVTAESFCSRFQFYNGTPLNVREQQDASEFFNRLCDLMKENLDKIKSENFITDIIEGSYVNRYTCKSCKHVHDSEQEMYNLHLSVKDRADMYESLKANYTTSELLSGYKCEGCGETDQTEKVCLLKRLPNVLICSLKRFELNYNTFEREKVNSKFEFPEELNLWKFTHQGFDQRNIDNDADNASETGGSVNDTNAILKKTEFNLQIDANSNKIHGKENENFAREVDAKSNYKLKGIVIHSGSANGGHYYSFIKNQNNDDWVEYNDLIVRSWDYKTRLVRDCFGGSSNSDWSSWQTQSDNHQSAYMLVYERNSLVSDSSNMNHRDDKIDNTNRNHSNFYGRYLPERIGEQIASENKYFSQLQRTFDTGYLNFLANVIEKITDIEVNSGVKNIYNLPAKEHEIVENAYGMDLYYFVLRSYLYIFRRAVSNDTSKYNAKVGKALKKLFALKLSFKRVKSLCF
jgi:ubiquitin C-terminal hydrolase